jgi:hypothetical protein
MLKTYTLFSDLLGMLIKIVEDITFRDADSDIDTCLSQLYELNSEYGWTKINEQTVIEKLENMDKYITSLKEEETAPIIYFQHFLVRTIPMFKSFLLSSSN